MKAIHIYDLSDTDDIIEYTNAINGTKAIIALWQVQGMLRTYWKHADLEGMTADQLIDEIWEKFYDIANSVLEATE